jgi:hypothetical protein
MRSRTRVDAPLVARLLHWVSSILRYAHDLVDLTTAVSEKRGQSRGAGRILRPKQVRRRTICVSAPLSWLASGQCTCRDDDRPALCCRHPIVWRSKPQARGRAAWSDLRSCCHGGEIFHDRLCTCSTRPPESTAPSVKPTTLPPNAVGYSKTLFRDVAKYTSSDAVAPSVGMNMTRTVRSDVVQFMKPEYVAPLKYYNG